MKFIFECDEFLKYLYSNTYEQIQLDTALEKSKTSISKTTLQKWKTFNMEHLDPERIDALNKGAAKIAVFQDVERLCEMIKMDNSTPNAKRVFNMLISVDENLKYVYSDAENTSLAKYMKQILNVKNDVNYLPGRSVDLSMLCNYGIKAENKAKPIFTRKGILAGLKALAGLGLVEAFKVVEAKPDVYETKPVLKEDITADEDIIFRLSIKGCADYIK